MLDGIDKLTFWIERKVFVSTVKLPLHFSKTLKRAI
jgi:hypothetical protein